MTTRLYWSMWWEVVFFWNLPLDTRDSSVSKVIAFFVGYKMFSFGGHVTAMTKPDAKAAVDKELKKFETIHPSMESRKKSRARREVIREAQRDRKKVHNATLLDMSLHNCGVGTKISEVQRLICVLWECF